MEDCLTAVGTCVDNETISSPGNGFFLGEFARNGKEMTGKLFICRFQRADRFDMSVWDDQDMSRCNRMRIAKGSDLIILVKKGRADIP